MDTEHHPDSSVFAPDVCLTLPQLDVWVSELQDSSTVDSAECKKCRKSLSISLIKAFTHAERIKMGHGPIIQTTELTNVKKKKWALNFFIDPKTNGFCELYGSFWRKSDGTYACVGCLSWLAMTSMLTSTMLGFVRVMHNRSKSSSHLVPSHPGGGLPSASLIVSIVSMEWGISCAQCAFPLETCSHRTRCLIAGQASYKHKILQLQYC